jgi:hypothetical protein
VPAGTEAALVRPLEDGARAKDERLTEIVVLAVIGRAALPIGLVLALTHAYVGRPEHLARPLVGTAAGVLLLAAAASRLDDARWLATELVRGLGFAALLVAAAAVRVYVRRVPHALSGRESIAALASAAGFAASFFWLRRERKA